MKGDADKLKLLLPSEEALCAAFIEEFNKQPGWTCYPEFGGFDILVSHESGRQIGVEAKLVLNAKVADQILPSDSWHRYGDVGPDHRLVIVRSITDANAGIARLLEMSGVQVWAPRVHERWLGSRGGTTTELEFNIAGKLRDDESVATDVGVLGYHFWPGWFDWNPPKRIVLSDVVPSLPAGVPAPVRLTPWKQAAVRVLARLRVQGCITAKEITSEGCSPSMWTQRWLARGSVRGTWVETKALPPFDQQHPDLYAAAFAKAKQTHEKEVELAPA